MRLFTKYALTLSAIALMTGSTLSSAFADYKPNRLDTGPTREQIEELGYTGILPLDKTGITLLQRANAPANELIFYFILPLQVEGCYDNIPFELEQKIEASILVIEMKYPIMRLDAHKDCKKQRNMEIGEIAVNLDELREKNVNLFKLTSRYSTRSYEVDLNDERIILEPTESVLLPKLQYWFLPSNTVVLNVPMANEDIYYRDAMLQELAMLAEQNGLIPVEEQIPEYMPHTQPYNKFFFLDTKGDIRELLNKGDEHFVRIGSIHTSEPFYGPNGKYDKKIPLDVLATLPSAID